MAEYNIDIGKLPEDVREKLAELDLELSEGKWPFSFDFGECNADYSLPLTANFIPPVSLSLSHLSFSSSSSHSCARARSLTLSDSPRATPR